MQRQNSTQKFPVMALGCQHAGRAHDRHFTDRSRPAPGYPAGMTTLNSDTRAVAFIATSRPVEALAFYSQTLGLKLVEESPYLIVFDAFGTLLRVQKVQSVQPHAYTTLGFEVTDIESAARRLADAGVIGTRYPGFEQDTLGIWTAPSGTRVLWVPDPDGNVISLSQGA
jgi:catechol 2,3-dioxygenase-like lactoylglutathione lyase family enzyme